ncbi:hypothetical protein [Zooshikella harenae]|uniref:DUF3108 domain-containing protein n=1 Tax=Zooshikella harenae TaxID=2827238 RepID=A0ABS5ZB02_9GAMM|nr:hypothetical protein [Zooshikella harenae]MBU2711236.1 hypothetical protein [Zooshikella harenae]
MTGMAYFFLSVFILLTAFPLSASTIIEATGKAYDLESGRPVYIEKHIIHLVKPPKTNTLSVTMPLKDKVTYTTPDGNVFATKTVNYETTPLTPTIVFNKLKFNQRESVFIKSNNVIILHEEDNQRQEHQLPLKPNLVIDAGFDTFIRKHWSKLLANKSFSFEFLSINENSTYTFQIEKTQEDSTTASFTMSLDSFIGGFFVDPIIITYEKKEQKLIRYQGLTNIPKDKETNFTATIIYTYNEKPVAKEKNE